MKPDPSSPASYRDVVSRFAQRTSAHGVSHIQTSRPVGRRALLWSVLVLVSSSVVLYQVITLVEKFLSYEVETELKVSFNRHMPFPAVTVCNLNALRLSKLVHPDYMPRDILAAQPAIRRAIVQTFHTRPWLLNLTFGAVDFNVSQDSLWREIKTAAADREPSAPFWSGDGDDNSTTPSDTELILEALGVSPEEMQNVEPGMLLNALYAILLAYIDESVVAKVGHQPEDFILYCAFDGFLCNYTDFYEFQTDSFGNCFTFNHGRKGAAVLQTGYSGPKHALRMEFNVEQYEYITSLQETVGVRLVVHDQGIRPFPQEEGITVAPGYHTNIGINRNGITRLPLPHGTCTNGTADKQIPGYKYSVMSCLKLCLQRAVIETCGCKIPYLPYRESLPSCSFRDEKEDYLCMVRVLSLNLSFDKRQCTCPESCHELSFNILLSFADWPNVATQKKDLTEIVGLSDVLKVMPQDDSLTDIRENLLRVDLYYQELNDIQIVQREGYGWLSLVSDIGGQLGLWIGMSVLTICEGLELLIDLLMVALARSSKPSQQNKPDINPVRVT